MRACDHQMLTQGYVAEVMEPDKIPADFRYFGTKFPFLGKAMCCRRTRSPSRRGRRATSARLGL